MADDLRVPVQAALQGLQQAALAQLATAHHQVVGHLAPEDAGQQLLAAEEGVFARDAAPRLIRRDARDPQLGGERAQQHRQRIGAQQPLALRRAVQQDVQIGAIGAVALQCGVGGFTPGVGADQQHIHTAGKGLQAAHQRGALQLRRGKVDDAAVQRHRQVGRKHPGEDGAGQVPAAGVLAACAHPFGQALGLLSRLGLGVFQGLLPVCRFDARREQAGAQAGAETQQAVQLGQTCQRRAAQALRPQLAGADQRVAQQPEQRRRAEHQGAEQHQPTQPAEGFSGGPAGGLAVHGQQAGRNGRAAGAAIPLPGGRIPLQQQLGARQTAQIAALGHAQAQLVGAGRAGLQQAGGVRRRMALDVGGPAALLHHGLAKIEAPLRNLGPDRADLTGRLQAGPQQGIELGRQQRAAHQPGQQGDQQPPQQRARQGDALHGVAACSTARPVARTISLRQCSWAPPSAGRVLTRLAQNRARSRSSCR